MPDKINQSIQNLGVKKPVVLIIGGAGFIGNTLAREIQTSSLGKVIILDSFIDEPYPALFKHLRCAKRDNALDHNADNNFDDTTCTNISEMTTCTLHDTESKVASTEVSIPKTMNQNHSNICTEIIQIHGDATNTELLVDLILTHKFDVIYHLAAQPGVRSQTSELKSKAFQSNVTTLQSLCNSIDIAGGSGHLVNSLVFTSSSSVYGSDQAILSGTGCLEEQQLAPIGDYASQKMNAELFLQVWASSSTFAPQNVSIVRPFSVYGPWGRPDMLPLKMLHRAYTGEESDLAQLPDGTELLRDYTYVGDVVQGLLLCSGLIRPINERTQVGRHVHKFNLGYGKAHSLLALATELATMLGRPIAIRRSLASPADVPFSLANTDKVIAGLSWRAKVPLQMGLKLTKDWYVHDLPTQRAAIVVIATKDRPELLRRALFSVREQILAPLAVIVVDDSQNTSKEHDTSLIMMVHGCLPDLEVHILNNKRTPGASGAWNTGILQSIKIVYDRGLDWHQTFVSILDDDDEWLSHHLKACMHQAQVSGAQQVVPGIVRVTNSMSEEGRRAQKIPDPHELTRNAFYTGNPHIQGSNMFMSISLLARTGLFNEGLLSTTDRDLMARVAFLPLHERGAVSLSKQVVDITNVHEVSRSIHTVLHYCESERTDRLSTIGSPSKQAGLRAFLSNHGPSMQEGERKSFIERAFNLFHCDPLSQPSGAVFREVTTSNVLEGSHLDKQELSIQRPVPLIVGIVSSADDGSTIVPLLKDLGRMQSECNVPSVQLYVLVLENGVSDKLLLRTAVHEASSLSGMLVATITMLDVIRDTDDLFCSTSLLDTVRECISNKSRLSIADGRTIIQKYAYLMSEWLDSALSCQTDLSSPSSPGSNKKTYKRSHPQEPIVWILDDDKSLDPLFADPSNDGSVTRKWVGDTLMERILRVQASTGAAVVFGQDTEAPPLPIAACLRLQLIDVSSVLLAAAACSNPSDTLVPCNAVRATGACRTPAQIANSGEQDYYHDLSSCRFDQLESPMCPVCLVKTGCWGLARESFKVCGRLPTAQDALHLVSTFVLPQILRGAAVTRPLCLPAFAEKVDSASLEVEDSLHRGGCTFIFDRRALRDVPNLSPMFQERRTRRSDMIWALINRCKYGRKCVKAKFIAVRHRRLSAECDKPQLEAVNIQRVLSDDILGHAMYRSLNDAFLTSLTFADLKWDVITHFFMKSVPEHLWSRSLMAQLSYGRIHGLLSGMINLLRPSCYVYPLDWNLKNQEPSLWLTYHEQTQIVIDLLNAVKLTFQVDSLWLPNADIGVALPAIPPLLSTYESAYGDKLKRSRTEESLRGWLQEVLPNESIQSWRPTSSQCKSVSDRIRAKAACALTSAISDTDTVNRPTSQIHRAMALHVGGEGITLQLLHTHPFLREEKVIKADDNSDDGIAVKVMDLYRLRASASQLNALVSMSKNWPKNKDDLSQVALLQPLEIAKQSAVIPILIRPWVTGTVYKGGHGPSLVTLLRTMKKAGVICNNVTCANLIVHHVTSKSKSLPEDPHIALVDYGLDIQQYTDARFFRMSLRAFLCWRWGAVYEMIDLCKMLRASRTILEELGSAFDPLLLEEKFPLAAGFSSFFASLNQEAGDIENSYSEFLAGAVTSPMSTSVLDFGCGKGKMLLAISDKCTESVTYLLGYDPDVTCVSSWEKRHSEHKVQFTTNKALLSNESQKRGGFDTVVCCRVICALALESDEAGDVLRDIATFTAPNGTVFLGVCHPSAAHVQSTTLQRRFNSRDLDLSEPCAMSKQHNCSNKTRQDFHRPYHVLVRMIRKAGMEPIGQINVPQTIDLTRFEAISELMVLVCKKVNSFCLPQPLPLHNVSQNRTALLIKTCAMEWRMLPSLVQHIVTSLEGPHAFNGGIFVVIDGKRSDFPRQYTEEADYDLVVQEATKLKRQGWIDEVILAGVSPSSECIVSLMKRWFGTDCLPDASWTHAVNGSPLFSTLFAFEFVVKKGAQIVIQVDSDIMVRRESRHQVVRSFSASGCRVLGQSIDNMDYLTPILKVFEEDKGCITVSLPVCPEPSNPNTGFTSHCMEANESPTQWRTEVRACALHLPRLISALPLPLELVLCKCWGSTKSLTNEPRSLPRPWYRALDSLIAMRPQSLRSYRGGLASAAYFIHPPNSMKSDLGEYGAMLDYVERGGKIPAQQNGCVDAVGKSAREFLDKCAAEESSTISRWRRGEDFIFVVTGKCIEPGRVQRCLESICRQRVPTGCTWGVIVVWDNPFGSFSSTKFERSGIIGPSWIDGGLFVENLCSGRLRNLIDRTTLLMPRCTRGTLANIMNSIRSICCEPASVIAVVDMDDALIGGGVLEMLHKAFWERGCDVMAGGLLRTDKANVSSNSLSSPFYKVDFTEPRRAVSGGNVWSHLRAARCHVFRELRDIDLRPKLADTTSYWCSSNGMWDRATDWAMMLPIVEMAWRVAQPTRAVYF